ncbi:H-NS family nucleoid-associated regulatory protein [Aliiroseovarius sp. xm-g-7]|uniref:H-NS histone family protein n=1 Tax=Aliiroseovarius sp. xm-g-7 TaxID=2651826 RepID=UPI001567E181|nr:H-NS histone family protein [Aliiroseovarius sp. xm-g-7]NRQ27151.1 Trans-acting regulatory protein HvrA [Aliiroseovarius sp. xm-g-7]
MTKDIKQMSYEELREHIKQAEEELLKQKDDAISKVAADVHAFINRSGFTLSEVLAKMGVKEATKKSSSGSKAKAPEIYFNPADPSDGWSGKGRTPNWVKKELGRDKISLKDPEIYELMEKYKK